MKKWQRYWLYSVILYAALHLTRDIFQDLGLKNWLSTILVKGESKQFYPLYWGLFNTYVAAILEIGLAATCLKRNRFGRLGWLTIGIVILILAAWLFYWFFL